ncbi:CRISPR-associated endonuclease Cas1 [Sphingomonas sp. AAP5]|uniref:CRISPR-associated endonuclease Cas1 n=1 Tax=Sphingomonas sp. AAP5 TaxID=1523415 RepID=UPI001056F0BE|nr:CRISPR-associated endonuclease Cas1 [Sphingomonas sp. AAP5]QBM74547.1 CRISPR-associated endonuclease Cas1 [Sphingomonas sp. AAP5]
MKHEIIAGLSEWTVRSDYWLQKSIELGGTRALRERQSTPLILTGDGVHMRVEKGSLHIRGGLTHYRQEPEVYRFFRGDLDLPPRIVAVDCSGGLSFDVLAWLAEQDVTLICLDWKGDGVSVQACNGYAADRGKVRWQQETRADETARITFAADLIQQKLAASIETLEAHISPSRSQALALRKSLVGIERLASDKFGDLNAVFAIEGECASAYFAAWQGMAISWKGTKRHPVPDAWLTYKGRSSLANGVKPENRNASHPVNALLNYAYAVTLQRLQIQAIADGYDPTLGIMHSGKRGNPAFILDLIEPKRSRIDAMILAFVAQHTFSGADFVIRENGGCRLSPQLARHVSVMLLDPAYCAA